MDENSGSAYRVTADELRQFVERFENLEIEKRGIVDQQKEVMAEAKGRGYDTKILRKLVCLEEGICRIWLRKKPFLVCINQL